MPSQIWTPGTVINSVWLQEVNDFVFSGGGSGGSGNAIPTVKDSPYSATGNGTTADQAAFVAASAAIPQFRVPPGTYRFSANTTIAGSMDMDKEAIISADSGVTVTITGQLNAGRSTHFTGAGTFVFAPGSIDNVKAEWFGLSTTGTEAGNTAALQKAWVAGFGTGVSVGRGAYPLGDTELKAFALNNTSQLPNFLIGMGVDGNGGASGSSTGVGTSFFGPSARIHFNNDAPSNSDAKIIIGAFHIVGPNDDLPGVGGIKMTKMSGAVVDGMQVTGSRGNGGEFIDCYGVVVENNTFLLCRQHGLLANRRFNQSVFRNNKCIGNCKDYTGIYANMTFAGGATFESLGPVVENNDTSYAGSNAVLYRVNSPAPGPRSIVLTSIVVSGTVATATTATPHGRATNDFISVFGCAVAPALNTFYSPQITVTSPTTFTWTTSAPAATYTESTLVIGPAAYGASYNDIRGGSITTYAEDCIGPALYMGANCMATKLSGGYDQGFNTPGGGNGIILLDNPSYINVEALSLSGANTVLRVATTERKHGVNIASTVTVENGAQIQYGVIELRDGQYYATAAPTAGTWRQGDWVQNLNASPGSPQGWYCSAAPNTFIAIDAAAGGGASLPSQSGQAGRVLGTNGTVASWVATTASLPSQTGQAGKYLGTDGTTISWSTVSGGGGGSLPSQTGNSGRVLTTDGTNASWASSITFANTTITGGLSATTANFTGNTTVGGTFTGGVANYSGNVTAAGHLGGTHSGTTANFSGGLTAASLVATSGGASITGAMSVGAFSGNSLTVSSPSGGTGLRITTSGGGSTGMTIDGSAGGTAIYVIGSMRLDLGTASGTSFASTSNLANKPGGPSDIVWIPVVMNGVQGDIPWWPR